MTHRWPKILLIRVKLIICLRFLSVKVVVVFKLLGIVLSLPTWTQPKVPSPSDTFWPFTNNGSTTLLESLTTGLFNLLERKSAQFLFLWIDFTWDKLEVELTLGRPQRNPDRVTDSLMVRYRRFWPHRNSDSCRTISQRYQRPHRNYDSVSDRYR